MNIEFHEHRTYPSSNAFISHNPWFDAYLVSQLQNHLNSDRLKYKIRNEVDERITQQFPSLWAQQMVKEPTWLGLKAKLEDQTNLGVARVNSATDTRVNDLMSGSAFEPLRSSIFNAAMNKYSVFEASLDARYSAEEASRNAKIQKVEADVREVQAAQWGTFFGGLALGAGLALIGCHRK